MPSVPLYDFMCKNLWFNNYILVQPQMIVWPLHFLNASDTSEDYDSILSSPASTQGEVSPVAKYESCNRPFCSKALFNIRMCTASLQLMNYYSYLMNTSISILDSTMRLVERCANDTSGAGPTFPFLPLGTS